MSNDFDLSARQFGTLRSALKSAGFAGDIEDNVASRAAMSTDNSVYQIMPDIIVAPRDRNDVQTLVRVLRQPPFAKIGITARGGGTGTNGQSLNTGLIVDFRRHMNAVLAVNTDDGWADVEPGVVLDELNEELAPTGLFFAPNTSTANRCTIGGMVSTDASGKGSRIYGKTSDNIIGLEVVVGDGSLLDSLVPSPGSATARLQEVATACDAGRSALLDTVPRLSRRFSGYDLERTRPDAETLEWWRLFLGAEGTLGLVTKIRVKLVKKPKLTRLVVLAYDSFTAALASGQKILSFAPHAIETLDERVQGLAEKAGLLEDLPRNIRGHDGQRPVYNFVEFAGDDGARLDRQASDLIAGLAGVAGIVGHHLAVDPSETARLWATRAASVGLLNESQTSRKPVAFVEDCVVPPENLADFVGEFRALLNKEGLTYGAYGHIDVGCLHVRPALDIDQPEDRIRLKRVSDAVYAMVKRHGGIFWGEHGKGIRGEYLRDFVGPVPFEAFWRIKTAFDPDLRFNPGKLVSQPTTLKGIGSTPFRSRTKPVSAGPIGKAFACDGNALCLNYAHTTPMCPSFKATNDLRHSPKGRAEAIKAWSQAVETKSEALAAVEAATFAALDGCLGCKACSSACPVHVDIPELKSHFLAHYHTSNPRRLSDLAGIWLERFAPQLSRARPVLRLAHMVGLQGLVARALSLVDTPAASRRGLGSLGYPLLTAQQVASHTWSGEGVLVGADAFTTLFDTQAIADICDGLKSLGYDPAILALPPGGKAAHVKGDRVSFTQQASVLRTALDLASVANIPIVGADPAFVLMLRTEYRAADLEPTKPVLLAQEFLLASHEAGAVWPQPKSVILPTHMFLHCAEASAKPTALSDWNQLFAKIGLPVTAAPTGCCGMAGLYGHEIHHQADSAKLFDMSWRPAIADQQEIFATGFSCRCQTERMAGKQAIHPFRMIAQAMSQGD